jgi:prevent-host-death family protein
MTANTWKLQDAKARFSEVVRLARSGTPQIVTVHGEDAVVISAAKTSGSNEASADLTMAGFVERSKKYRGPPLKIPRRIKMKVRFDPVFDENDA